MSNQPTDSTQRVPQGLLSALGVDRTVAMIIAGLCVMAFLILTAIGHEPESATGNSAGAADEDNSVFSQPGQPGVDVKAAE